MCSICAMHMVPRFRLLPCLPFICLGGYFFDYDRAVQTILREVKFNANFKLAQWLDDPNMMQGVPSIFFDSDAFACVPSHWVRQLFRGTPHIPYLFRRMMPFISNESMYLKRIRYTRSSVGLSRQERVGYSEKPRFGWVGPAYESVVILDDVVTTGTTVSDIACVLRQKGVQNVMVLAMAYRS